MRAVTTNLLRASAAIIAFALPRWAAAQIEPISVPLMGPGPFIETFEFPHDHPPGGGLATELSFMGGVAPFYPEGESHTLVVTFTWRLPDMTLVTSPDNVYTIPGGTTYPVDTGIFELDGCPDLVGIQFAGGAGMTIVGEYTHLCVVPEPAGIALGMLALASLALVFRRSVTRAQ